MAKREVSGNGDVSGILGSAERVDRPDSLELQVGSYYTSLDVEQPGNLGRLLTALQTADMAIDELEGGTILVTDIVVTSVDGWNAGGTERQVKHRIVLIDANGQLYSCITINAMRAIGTLFASAGVPPWTTPVSVTPRKLGERRSFRGWLFDVAPAEQKQKSKRE